MRHHWEPIGVLPWSPGFITAEQLAAARRLRIKAGERGAYIEMSNERQREPRVDQDDVAQEPASPRAADVTDTGLL